MRKGFMIVASIMVALIVSILLICLDQLIRARIGVVYEGQTRIFIGETHSR
ncbi:hypothetical protein [Thermotoga caldifontis]|uniref:hypothetical protein n=1 Tax=Thermotoga caldifontis TaxID=1508419 RepID=UPI000A832CE4|nr:hypothetical protein [Thermotoga caldifontis]